MTLDNNPYEVGLDWQVDPEKEGDYIGKEALRAIKDRGAQRKLIGIEIAGAELPGWPESYWPVSGGGNPIGHVTAAVYSPGLNKNIGYAMVPSAWAGLNTPLQIESPWGRLEAKVVRKPFIDPQKDIPKS